VSFTTSGTETRVKVSTKEEFILRGVIHPQVGPMTGGVVITASP
jgi:hypothetical protein